MFITEVSFDLYTVFLFWSSKASVSWYFLIIGNHFNVCKTSSKWFCRYDWFEPYNATTMKEVTVGCFENYVLFATSSFQYIILAVAFSKGPPYRKPITSNYGMLFSSVAMTALTSWLVIGPPLWVEKQFELKMPPDTGFLSFRVLILIYALANFILATIVETFLIDYIVFRKLR